MGACPGAGPATAAPGRSGAVHPVRHRRHPDQRRADAHHPHPPGTTDAARVAADQPAPTMEYCAAGDHRRGPVRPGHGRLLGHGTGLCQPGRLRYLWRRPADDRHHSRRCTAAMAHRYLFGPSRPAPGTALGGDTGSRPGIDHEPAAGRPVAARRHLHLGRSGLRHLPHRRGAADRPAARRRDSLQIGRAHV